ncbi:related to thioredoxin [Fusarium torulosum]|uniref:Thioredoxin n=1 Tax=Fusarium torulosum TaxID=33205 RepID=A0AAE8MG35_9HYPO|nr:related to thioredoxin [Fusarium torulosum]
MTVTEVQSLEEFHETLGKHSLVLVDFWAEWCGPCRIISPVVEKLSQDIPSVHFVKVDVDQAVDIAQEYNIRAMPTFIMFKHGEKVGEVVGADPSKVKALVHAHV